MPVAGTKPKPDGQRRRRNAPTFEWAEVVNEPYTGEVPVDLPEGLKPDTLKWWSVVSSMPHCVLWTEGDWQFARASVLICDAFIRDPLKGEKALRDREKILGTTYDYRRDLRIRYVDVTEQATPSEVTSIADYRALAASHHAAAEGS